MADSATQRSYTAPCPGCGAPVEFKSAQSIYAVCPYCQSTVVRDGDVLKRIGKMAEVFDDYSPLQLGASGKMPLDGKDVPFMLVGRAQYKGEQGSWNEWNAFLPDGSLATLSEDNGNFVFTRGAPLGREVPAADRFRVGMTTAVGGKQFSVSTNITAALVAAQGELPKLAPLGKPFTVVELRSDDGEVLSIDYGTEPPQIQRGFAVKLDALNMKGLKDGASAKDEKARQFSCPNCGATVTVALDSTKSCTCPSCKSIIDLTNGIGGEMRAAAQDEPVEPLIPLGRIGEFEGAKWQVVGFQHRMGVEPGDDEWFGWDEYLLFHAKRGFIFLVDSTDGWSLVRPATGAPKYNKGAQSTSYLGTPYRLQYSYNAETNYVLGEFYWPVQRGQKTFNSDFESSSGKGILSREESKGEVTWSHGERMDARVVAEAFKMTDKFGKFKREDAAPAVSASGIGCGTVILILVILFVVLIILSTCTSSSGGSGYRSSGGSYGGYSSGGGHK